MKISFGKLLPIAVAALVVASFTMAPRADAAGGRGGGGGGGGGHAAAAQAGGGGGARAGGAQGGGAGRQQQVDNARADARANNVRGTSVNSVNNANVNRNVNNVNTNRNVNNVNVDRNVNVNVNNNGCCNNGWDNNYHPVATAAAVTATVAVTSAVVGSMVRTVPAGCVPVNYGGMVYQQCGATWYAPQGSQYIVVTAPY